MSKINPTVLNVEDESHRHHVPDNAETHFKVLAVSSQFSNLNRIQRHRLVNKLLALEFENGLHALSLHLHTPEEWQANSENRFPTSPACRDGYKHG